MTTKPYLIFSIYKHLTVKFILISFSLMAFNGVKRDDDEKMSMPMSMLK